MKACQHIINAINALTDCARSGAELTEALVSSRTFVDLDARLRAGLDVARHTIDLARDDARARMGK